MIFWIEIITLLIIEFGLIYLKVKQINKIK